MLENFHANVLQGQSLFCCLMPFVVTNTRNASYNNTTASFFFQDGVFSLSDKEIQMLVESKTIPAYQLEKVLNDPSRAVKIRYQLAVHFMKFAVLSHF